jgi:hypothetical protein
MFLARSLGSQVVGEQETLLLLGFHWDSTAEGTQPPTTNHPQGFIMVIAHLDDHG